MIKHIRRRYRHWRDRRRERRKTMQHQRLTAITRGLQDAAAKTNSLVAEQYIRILSEYFDRHEDGTLEARMVRVQLDDSHYAMVPLVSLVAPTGLALDRMRVQLSVRLEDAEEERSGLISRIRGVVNQDGGEEEDDSRAGFKVSLSPRNDRQRENRPSDHVHIDLEFKGLETPESMMRVIDTYTNMIKPLSFDGSDPRGPNDQGNTKQKTPPDGDDGPTDSEPAPSKASKGTT